MSIPQVWFQIGGDVNPREHGAILGKYHGIEGYVEIVEIVPEALLPDGGDGFWVERADIPVEDLEWSLNRDVARSHGWRKALWEDLDVFARAQARLHHWGSRHLGGDGRIEKTWSKALPAQSRSIRWQKTPGFGGGGFVGNGRRR
jgi:hypothetical protein